MILTLLKGMMIGVLVSAPMGPVGVLVIQRTLSKGRWYGFFSGKGAMVSDLFYAMITGLGLSFVTEFIKENESGIQLLGSIVLIGFGLWIYRTNPVSSLRKSRNGSTTYWQDFATAFFLTLFNPLIIFLFIGLFARFNFISGDFTYSEFFLGLLGVAVGAMLWWTLITSIFASLREKFNLRRLLLVNKLIGGVIMAIALVGFVISASAQISPYVAR